MKRYALIIFLVAVAACAGCLFLYRTKTPLTKSAASAVNTAEFGGVSLRIEFATTTAARESGLGGRTVVPDGYGMLFVFPKDDRYGFWMKDMIVPIDIFWLDAKGQVVSIASDVPAASYPRVFYPTVPARYVLETSAGFDIEHGIVAGTRLSLKNIPIVSE